jgi:hypothetical protein
MSAFTSSLRTLRRRVAVPALLIAGLTCGMVASERDASAQVIEIAPPVARVEVIGRPPSPHHFWAPGYWGWEGGRHVWVGGGWRAERPGWAWSAPRWGRQGRHWRLAPGHWHRR